MKLVVPDLSPVGTGVGHSFLLLLPAYIVAFLFKFSDKLFLCSTLFHQICYLIQQFKLPAVALLLCSVFPLPQVHTRLPWVVRLEHFKSVSDAYLVIELTHFRKRKLVHVQLLTVCKTRCIDNKMIVVLSVVKVSRHQDLVLWKELLDELHTDTVSLLGCDVVLGTERLDILIESDIVFSFAESHLLLGGIESLCGKKRFLCKLGHAVVTADQLDLLVELRLVRSDAVAYEPALRRGSLFALGDILNDSYVFSLSFAIVSSSFSYVASSFDRSMTFISPR